MPVASNGTNGPAEDHPGAPPPGINVRALSELLQRYQFANQAGLGFDSNATQAAGWNRDYYFSLGYKKELSVKDFRAEYNRGGIAETIVEFWPDATWSGDIDIQEDPDPGVDTEFEIAARALFKRLDVWAKLLRADILSGIGSYGGILIGAPGLLSEEMPRLGSSESVLYLRPLGEDSCTVKSIVGEKAGSATDDPRFGLPETYSVKLSGNRTETVHWSRIIHIVDSPLDDEVYGKSRLRPVYNYLQDLLKVVGGGSEATWRRVNRLTLFDLDPELEIGSGEADNLKSQIEDVVHGLKSYATTRGVTPRDLTGSVPSIAANTDTLIKLISGTSRIPTRVLTGSERGELASSQDRTNVGDETRKRRNRFAGPLVLSFINRLIDYGALPQPAQPIEILWPEEDELTEVEKAEVADKMALANKNQVEATGEPLVTSDEIRDSLLKRPSLEEAGWEAPARPPAQAPTVPQIVQEQVAAESFEFVDRAPPDPEWKAVHRAADAELDEFTRTIAGVWEAAADALDGRDDQHSLEALLAADKYAGRARVMEVLGDAESIMRSAVRGRMLSTLTAGAEAALRSVRARGSFLRGAEVDPSMRRAVEFSARFDATNPRALEWAREQSSVLITEIGPETLAAMQALIEKAFADGVPPAKLARQIRESIGLRTDQIKAVANLEAEFGAAKAGTTIERFPPSTGIRTRAGFRAKVPAGGPTTEWVDAQLSRYRTMQRNYRARTIARTETLHASNAGQHELWRQAKDSGQIAPDQKRVWISTPDDRVRPEHAERDGVVVGVDEEWPWGTEPGEEVACRCSQGLATPADLERVAA